MSVVQTIKDLKSVDNLNFVKRLEIKENGRPLPELQIKQSSKDKTKPVNRYFRSNMYDLCDWICGCEVTNAFYCFVCLIFTNDPTWCQNGVTDLKHLKEKIRKHSLSADHMKSSMNFVTMGRVDIRSQLDGTYRKSIKDFNESVTKNRYILNKIIDCVKFCGAFELALRSQDEETQPSTNPGVFHGLINLISELDSIFKEYLENSTVFKGTSETVQNDLLESMLAIAQGQIKSEIKSADFIALQVDEITDSSNKAQMVFVMRYVLKGVVNERFLKFIIPPGTTPEKLTKVILQELEILEINKTPTKLIAQSYDGASSMSGKLGGIQTKIKQQYPAANFIHCYAHQLNLIIQKAVSQNRNVKIFFANLDGFSTFFNRFPKRVAMFDEFVKARLCGAAPMRWNFNTGCVETISLYRIDLIACLIEIIETEEDFNTINQALALKMFLLSEDFLYWLNFFHLIIPNCELLFEQLQNRGIDIISVKNDIATFKTSIDKIRGKILDEEIPTSTVGAKRHRIEDSKCHIALQVCDTIISEMNHRFSFTDHLIIAQLFYSDQFEVYKYSFPDHILKILRKDFPFINSYKLKTELEVIYERDDFRECAGAIAMLQLFINNNLCDTFSECCTVLNILCTLPMMTVESERCFSTLQRIKTFLRNTMGQDRLSALAMLSIEKSFINNIVNFNELVINHFANTEERRADLIFMAV